MKGVRLLLVVYILTVLVAISLAAFAFVGKVYYEFWIWNICVIALLIFPFVYFKIMARFANNDKKTRKKQSPKANKPDFFANIRIFFASLKPKRLFNKNFKKAEEKKEEAKKPSKKKQETKKEPKPKKEKAAEKNEPFTVNKEIKVYEKEPEKIEQVANMPAKPGPLQILELNKPAQKAETKSSAVKTDFDRIIEYLKGKKEVSFETLAKQFHIPHEKIEDWAKIMAEHGLVEITYPTFGDAKIKLKEEKKDA